jgi:hypothetical protein
LPPRPTISFSRILERLADGSEDVSPRQSLRTLGSATEVFLAHASAVGPRSDRACGRVVSGDGDAAGTRPDSIVIEDVERLLRTPLSDNDLYQLRRRFAFARHPDRVPASEREAADREMARANMLIDAALARCKPGGH